MTNGLDNINSHFSRTSQMDHQTLSYITSLSLPKIESFDFSPVFSEDINPIHSFRRGGKWRHRSHMIVTILDYVLLEYLISLIFYSTLVSFPLYEIMLSLHLNPKILTLLSLNNFDQYLFFIFFLKSLGPAFIRNSISLYISRTFSVPYKQRDDTAERRGKEYGATCRLKTWMAITGLVGRLESRLVSNTQFPLKPRSRLSSL